MPEVSNMAIPKKLLERGIQDLVRICDGRMSGTAFGTVVLHVSPEAAAGGPLSLIRSGDLIELDVPARTINVKLSGAELAARKPSQAMVDALAKPSRGWERMYIDHVEQAHLGADLDFLRGASGSATPRESH
jgi:dihydroxy-acid dehydratase